MSVEMEEVLSGLLPKGSEFVNFMKAAIAGRGRRVVICTHNSGVLQLGTFNSVITILTRKPVPYRYCNLTCKSISQGA
jgi:hypothetical protein